MKRYKSLFKEDEEVIDIFDVLNQIDQACTKYEQFKNNIPGPYDDIIPKYMKKIQELNGDMQKEISDFHHMGPRQSGDEYLPASY